MVYILEDVVDLCTSSEGYRLFGFIGQLFNILKIVVPILIVIMGSIDLVKALVAQKDDEMKKAQGIFIKRLILGVCVFFVFPIISVVFNMVDDANVDKNTNQCLWSVFNPDEAMDKSETLQKQNDNTNSLITIDPEKIKKCLENTNPQGFVNEAGECHASGD